MDKEWLTTREIIKEAKCSPEWLSKLYSKGELSADTRIKDQDKRANLYHKSIIPLLIARKQRAKKIDEGFMTQPKEAIAYDGYVLTPDEIRNLEAVRCRNGYRAMHYTHMSVTELIAIGGDKQNNYDYY